MAGGEKQGRGPSITSADRAILTRLAATLAEYAARPEEAAKKNLWYRHNRLEATRPLVFCDPENGWNEILPPTALRCEGALAREWELRLRKELFWAEKMGDDRVTCPVFEVYTLAENTGWGMDERRIGGENGGAYRWEAPLSDYSMLPALHYPSIIVDEAGTDARLALAQELFGSHLQVRRRGVWWWTLGLTWTLVRLRGLERIMYDMIDEPEGLHRLMAFLRDGTLHMLDDLEARGLLSLNNDGSYIASGGFGWSDELPAPGYEPGHARCIDLWGFAESQETTAVSPQMFGEFVLPYQLPILSCFGLNCYGCCEPIEKRWHLVKTIPRLRRVSVSPWASLPLMADALGTGYILSLKPNPAPLALPQLDEAALRAWLRQTLPLIQNCRAEIIMKDNHTLGGNPQNAVNWVRIVKEEIGAI